MQKWIYEQSEDGKNRYILGIEGENPLICIGVNPSTACPEKLDSTMRRVREFAEEKGYDSYIMLNLYPQRATDPNDMDEEIDPEQVRKNLESIENILKKGGFTVWAAWGNLITKRSYLKECVREIARIADAYSCTWITMGKRNKSGHPKHPLYIPGEAEEEEFDIHKYLEKLK